MGFSTVERCANPDCDAKFKRLGTGILYTLAVARPQAWGLPPDVKQKVVWLCAKCAAGSKVEFDKKHHQVVLVKREQSRRQVA